jgi:streptogramin lyase
VSFLQVCALVAAVMGIAFGVAVSDSKGQTIIVTEFPVLVNSPDRIMAGPAGALWFTGWYGIGNRVGRITADGVVTECVPCILGSFCSAF